MDAEGRAELAGADDHRYLVGILSRPRLVPRRAADSALDAGRRRGRRPVRSPPAAADVAVHPDGRGVCAGGARVFRTGAHLACAGAVGRHRPRAGVRRAGLSVAPAVARQQGPRPECDRIQLDPVQPGARDRTAVCRRGAGGVRHGRVLRPQRPVVSRGHCRNPVTARSTHSAHCAEAHA